MNRFCLVSFIWMVFIPVFIYSDKPTARTCIFAFYKLGDYPQSVDTLSKHFDLIVFNDRYRNWNDTLRDSTRVTWHRDIKPLTLVYKDALTLKGPGSPPTYDSTCFDSTLGGGTTVGGFWYFDSIFFGIGYPQDTSFLMATIYPPYPPPCTTAHEDDYGRVQAGESPQYEYRWALDYKDSLWRYFHACTTKVQCLRNYMDTTYDNTYFDGIFIDNLLHFVDGLGYGYRIYPVQYYDSNLTQWDANLRAAVDTFVQTVCAEYHNPNTPSGHPCAVLAIGNTNRAHMVIDGYADLWKNFLQYLDGVVEESDFARADIEFGRWQRMIHEMAIAESLGKMCLVHSPCSTEFYSPNDPLSVYYYDSTQMIYGFASYLMTYDSVSHFSFGGSGDYAHIYWAPILDIDLGKPMETYKVNISASDTFVYRHYEEGMVFANPRKNLASIAGFVSDTLYEIGPLCDIRDTLKGQFNLNHHNGKICLYPLTYFHGSGFEPDDRLCWENYCLEVQGITNYGAGRVTGDPPSPVTAHSGDWMYKIYGQDISSGSSFVRFKVFPYDIPIQDSTYFSFWIYVDYAPGDSAPIGIDC